MFDKSFIVLFCLLYLTYIEGINICEKHESYNYLPEGPAHYCLRKGYEWYEESCSCYKFHTKAVPWPDAYSICVEEGARLAIANSAQEADLLKKLFNTYPSSAIQNTQLTNRAAVGIFWDKWRNIWLTADGESYAQDAFAYQWEHGKPYTESLYPYAFIRRDGILANDGSLESYPFICEKNFTTTTSFLP